MRKRPDGSDRGDALLLCEFALLALLLIATGVLAVAGLVAG